MYGRCSETFLLKWTNFCRVCKEVSGLMEKKLSQLANFWQFSLTLVFKCYYFRLVEGAPNTQSASNPTRYTYSASLNSNLRLERLRLRYLISARVFTFYIVIDYWVFNLKKIDHFGVGAENHRWKILSYGN